MSATHWDRSETWLPRDPSRPAWAGEAMPLQWTHHGIEQARRRAIAVLVAELAHMEGRRFRNSPDRYLLTKDRVRELTGRYNATLLKQAEKATPIVVVVRDSAVISVFRPTRRINRQRRGPSRGRSPHAHRRYS